MTPEDIKALRKELGCTARQLAAALDLDEKTVFAWETGEAFPTKRATDRMLELRKRGPGAIPNRRGSQDALERLRDPKLWQLVRKLLFHPELYDEVQKLAGRYRDP